MIPFKCCLCLEPCHEFRQDFKTVLTDFMRLFGKFQSYCFNYIQPDELTLCKSCSIYFKSIHQFKHQLRLKKEICDANKSLLKSKIRRGQRSSADKGHQPSRKYFEVKIPSRLHNDDNDSDDSGQTGGNSAEAISYFLNNTDEPHNESLESSETAEVIATDNMPVSSNSQHKECRDEAEQPQANSADRNPILLSLLMAPVEDYQRYSPRVSRSTSFKNADGSDVESVGMCEENDVVTPTTNNVSTTAKSAEEEPVDAPSEDTSESSDLEFEPDESNEDPTEVTSVDTSESDSESEPDKTRQVTSRSKRLQKNTNRSSEWLIRTSDVKRLSEKEFTYLKKYPFQRTDVGFECGLCSAVSNIYNGSSRIWYNMLRHIHDWHMGSARVRSNKIFRRFIEIAPNRFQYGKCRVELIDGNYRCEECGELRAPRAGRHSAINIMEHIKRHHEDPTSSYVCEFCGKAYRSPFGLSEHKASKHDSCQFPCSECGKTFSSRVRTSLHEKKVHGTKKKFICEVCGKECSQKPALRRHIAFVHEGQKIKCDFCDKTFGSKMALNIHRHCHLGTKFICDICGMDFSQQCSVKRHKRTAHPQ